MDGDRFKKIVSALRSTTGIDADVVYAQENYRLIPYTRDLFGKNAQLYKAYGYTWSEECLGEVEWDGKCFFVPERTDFVRFIIVDDEKRKAQLDKFVEALNGLE